MTKNNTQFANIIQSVEFEIDPISFVPQLKFVGYLKLEPVNESTSSTVEETKLNLGKAIVQQIHELSLTLKEFIN
jgi:hypothetical protein